MREYWFKFYEEGYNKGLSESAACDYADERCEAFLSQDME